MTVDLPPQGSIEARALQEFSNPRRLAIIGQAFDVSAENPIVQVEARPKQEPITVKADNYLSAVIDELASVLLGTKFSSLQPWWHTRVEEAATLTRMTMVDARQLATLNFPGVMAWDANIGNNGAAYLEESNLPVSIVARALLAGMGTAEITEELEVSLAEIEAVKTYLLYFAR